MFKWISTGLCAVGALLALGQPASAWPNFKFSAGGHLRFNYRGSGVLASVLHGIKEGVHYHRHLETGGGHAYHWQHAPYQANAATTPAPVVVQPVPAAPAQSSVYIPSSQAKSWSAPPPAPA
jgi:hypothetical protein